MADSRKDYSKTSILRPNAVFIKIFGILVPNSFKDLETEFAQKHVKQYLVKASQSSLNKFLYARLQQDSLLDQAFGCKNPIISNVNDINSMATYVAWKMTEKNLPVKSPVSKLKTYVIDEGLAEGTLKVPVFSDAVAAVQAWRFGEYFIKNYTVSGMEKDDQKKYVQYTSAGDLTSCFNNYMPLASQIELSDSVTLEVLTKMIRDSPNNLLLITDSVKEAKAADDIGMMAIVLHRKGELISREDNITQASEKQFVPKIVSTFDEIRFINDPNKPPPCC